MISHVLGAGQTGQNDEDQVLGFDCVRKPKNIHRAVCVCVCFSHAPGAAGARKICWPTDPISPVHPGYTG